VNKLKKKYEPPTKQIGIKPMPTPFLSESPGGYHNTELKT